MPDIDDGRRSNLDQSQTFRLATRAHADASETEPQTDRVGRPLVAEQKPWTASDGQQATLSLHTCLHHQAAGVALARLLLIDGDLRTRRRCTLRSGFLRGRRSSLFRLGSPRHRHATQENRNPNA